MTLNVNQKKVGSKKTTSENYKIEEKFEKKQTKKVKYISEKKKIQ